VSRYNLIDEPWIPVRNLKGNLLELGMQDILLRAKEMAAIEDPSPLVVASLHRFLLAVLYRALMGPTDIEKAKSLFREGLPEGKIRAYLKKWRERFFLFDEKYPFGQNPNIPKDEIEPWTKLTAESNSTSNKVLFDHTDTNHPGERCPKECARWILSSMNYSISGGRGYYPSPSPNAMMCIPLGRNLHETLCYGLVPYTNREVMHGDSALWEREPKALPLVNPKRVAFGYADLYSWQSRMILLEELASGGVSVMRFIAGEGFDNPSGVPDPMQPYTLHKTYGRLPVQFRADKGTWRDFDSLLPDQDGLAPMTVQHAVRLAGGSVAKLPESVLVVGLKYTPPNANVDFWRMERFTLPRAAAGERYIRSDIHRFLEEYAKKTQDSLWSACSSYARNLLSRGNRNPDPKDVKAFVGQMVTIPWYWSILESGFYELLQDYELEREPDEIEREWLVVVRDALSETWKQHRISASLGDAWAIRALVKAEVHIDRKLKELNQLIGNLKEEAA
jgi:CRISPR system Cascade subunit CasA